MRVLLSIKPEFAEKILSGQKRFEFRKVVFKNQNVRSVVIYASSPVQKVVGEFDVQAILSMPPEDLWCKTFKYSGIEKDYFDQYFLGRETAFALKISSPQEYEKPFDLKKLGIKVPPQSFCYLAE
ncbi:ASCH domain-containing protein [Hydrogenovibrio kuenenii]|uniref:ASCH domain-containing protein n=1 Tax=Hydrogenovibrio kuenenii TaxID=63658 RepID=UPI0004661A2C|nr:ASCH domain-containing protein [Hydrogenovibrio kuenenii]